MVTQLFCGAVLLHHMSVPFWCQTMLYLIIIIFVRFWRHSNITQCYYNNNQNNSMNDLNIYFKLQPQNAPLKVILVLLGQTVWEPKQNRKKQKEQLQNDPTPMTILILSNLCYKQDHGKLACKVWSWWSNDVGDYAE